MRNSTIGDNWIRQMAEMNPIGPVLDKDGRPTENILTGPVRLAFVNLLKPDTRTNDDGSPREGKYGSIILFTPFSNMQPFYDAYYAKLAAEFANHYEPTSGQYMGVHSPFHDQAEKAIKYEGFTPGLPYLTVTSQYKPQIVDARMNPIVDENKVRAGVWAILSVNPYAYGKGGAGRKAQPKKGVGFGVQSVMIVGDDIGFGGGAPDPKQQFAQARVQAPTASPAAAFGQPMQHAPAPSPQQAIYGQHAGAMGAPQGFGGAPAYAPPAGAYQAPGYAPAPAEDDDMSAFLNS